MKDKTELEKIRMAVELRRRSYNIDLNNYPDSERLKGALTAINELLKKLQDIRYIEVFIEMKATKHMSDTEKLDWNQK